MVNVTTKGKPRGTSGGRKPKGEVALPKDCDFIVRPTQRQATYLGLAALVGMTKQDIVRQALDEFIYRQTGEVSK